MAPRRRPPRALPRLTLGRKLLLANLIVVLPLVVYFVAGFVWSSRALDDESRVNARHVKDQREALQLKGYLLAADDALFRFLATGDATWREAARGAMAAFDRQLGSEIAEETGPNAVILEQISALYRRDYEPLVALQIDDPRAAVDGARIQSTLRRLLAELDEYVAYHEGAIEAGRRDILASNSRLELLLGVSVTIAIALAGAAAVVMSWLLLRPVRDLEAVVHAYREGEAAARPRILPDDEIGDLGRAFVDALDRIDSQQELLTRLSVTDPLTGLFNRRRLDEILSQLSSADGPVVVAMIDIDDFKSLNDTCGHLAGDAVLREVGEIVRRQLRPGDIGARYGGEEICLLLFDADVARPEQAPASLERIRRTIERQAFPDVTPHSPDRVTVSVGGALWRDGESPLETLRRADQALYRAKQDGKNRVAWAAA